MPVVMYGWVGPTGLFGCHGDKCGMPVGDVEGWGDPQIEHSPLLRTITLPHQWVGPTHHHGYPWTLPPCSHLS